MGWREAERAYTDEVIGETPLPRLFEESAARHASREAQRYKGGVYDRSLAGPAIPPAPDGDFRALTYDELRGIVHALAAGFSDLGVEPGDRVAIAANTRMEWAQTDLALLAVGGVVATVYADSSPERVRYLLSDADVDGVVVENEALAERVLAVADDLDLSFVVSMDRLGEAYEEREDVHTLGAVYERGVDRFDAETYESWIDAIDLDDLATLVYTSGTTGTPKGVRLTHGNVRANVNGIRRRFGPRPDRPSTVPTIDRDTRTVSFLPLAHIFERTAGHFSILAAGGCVAYAESPDTLREDFGLVRPTVATSVPRVFERIYDSVRSQAEESRIGARVFEWAVDVVTTYQRTSSPGLGLRAKRALADRLVFQKVRDGLGGNVEMLISGGGSLSADLCALFFGMGLPICEGYGLTETAPVVTVNPPEAPRIGTIGPPLVDVEVRVDPSVVPDGAGTGDADGSDGAVGELLVRGPNVADGYWNAPEETAAAFTEDVPASKESGESEERSSSGRWFRTGDVVRILPDDYVVFVERVSQLLVLSTGKNVAPGPIEDAFAASAIVEQCMVIGDDYPFVGAIVVPNVARIRAWADESGISLPADDESLCRDDRVRARIGEEVDRVNRDLEGYERIRAFRLVPDEFTVENGLLTPTMKKRRRPIVEQYANVVDEIYEDAAVGDPDV